MGELRQRGRIWWLRYYRDGRRFEESSGTDKYEKAKGILKEREGDAAKGVPYATSMGRLRFDEAMTDLETEYTVNKRDSLDHLKRRIALHLKPWFGGRRMTKITAADINAYVEHRQKKGAAAASINRELAILKRAYTLAIRAGKLLHAHRPYIAMLAEHNVRTGFFEADQFTTVKGKLRPALQPVAEFAYLTGWRVQSEVLPLEWRNVDLKAGTVTLDPGTTKNGEGRTIYLTTALRTLLEAQEKASEALKARDVICPYVFHRNGQRIKVFYTGVANGLRVRPDARASSCTISGERRSATTSVPAFPRRVNTLSGQRCKKVDRAEAGCFALPPRTSSTTPANPPLLTPPPILMSTL